MKTLATRIQEVRAWLAPLVRDVPGSSHYIMELDAITHELSDRDCPHGWSKSSCRKCINSPNGHGGPL